MKIENLLEQIENSSKFETYFENLIKYNRKINLTAITEKREVFIKHFLDSVLPIDEIKPNASVVDVGTGAGFPGLPIKMLRQDISLTLVDSLNKRIGFLSDLLAKLNIKTNIIAENLEKNKNFTQKTSIMTEIDSKTVNLVHARAEDFCLNNRESFDVAVARAVAKLNTLLEYLLPLVKVGGIVLAYKGSNYETELNESRKAIEILGGAYEKALSFTLPDDMGERNIIVIKKIKPTPKNFPRAQNKPKTDPIK